MEGEPLSTFYTQLVLWPKVMQYAQYVLLALGGALLLVPVVYQVRSQVGGRGRAGGRGGAGCAGCTRCSSLPRRLSHLSHLVLLFSVLKGLGPSLEGMQVGASVRPGA
jgi:hypothetical protein